MITTGYNCITSRFGTGQESCEPVEGLPSGFILVPKGWSLNKATDTFNNAYVQEQIQLGNFVPFVNTFEMTGTTPEATTQESQSGTLAVVRQGKPTFTAIFQKNLSFQKAAFSYNSNNQYDVLITYQTGFIKAVESVDGITIKALTVGMLNTNGYQENNGTNAAQTTTMFQVVDPLEYNQYAFLLTDLDFNPNALNGIVNTDVVASADASDNKAYASVTWTANSLFPILGLLDNGNWRLTVNGVNNAVTGVTYNSTTGKYVLTPTTAITAGQSVVVQLYDDTVPVAVAKLGTKFYEGTSAAVTAVA